MPLQILLCKITKYLSLLGAMLHFCWGPCCIFVGGHVAFLLGFLYLYDMYHAELLFNAMVVGLLLGGAALAIGCILGQSYSKRVP